MVREGLGYTLRNYNPCFNYNADRFCCSERGAQFRRNIIASEGSLTPSTSYTAARNFDPNDNRPLNIKQAGIVDPNPYTFTPQDRSYIWCNRLPCSVDPRGVPCQSKQPKL